MEVRFRFSPTHQREGVRNMLMFLLWLQVIEVQLILGQLHLLPPHLLGKYLERTLHLLVICATLRHQLFLASCYLPQKRLSGGSCYTLINNCVVSRYFSRNNIFVVSGQSCSRLWRRSTWCQGVYIALWVKASSGVKKGPKNVKSRPLFLIHQTHQLCSKKNTKTRKTQAGVKIWWPLTEEHKIT